MPSEHFSPKGWDERLALAALSVRYKENRLHFSSAGHDCAGVAAEVRKTTAELDAFLVSTW